MIVAHDGWLSGLSALYLPAWFVTAMQASWPAILAATPVLWLGALAVALASRASRPRAWIVSALLGAAAFALALILHRFSDEVFINFRQARVFAESGRYSFLEDRNVDGSVDLAFYVVLAGLNRIGLDIPLGALLIGSAAFATTVVLAARFAWQETGSLEACWLAGTIVMLMPSLAGVGGAGWSSALIGMITAASIVCWFSSRWPWTFLMMGVLPLIRLDHAFYTVAAGAMLVAFGARAWGRPRKFLLGLYASSLGGVVAVAIFWQVYYGHLVPTPILLKAGQGVLVERLPAVLRLHGVSMLREIAPALLLAAGLLLAPARVPRALSLLAWLAPAIVHFFAVALHGGDHHEWHRYHTVLLVACAAAMSAGLPGVLSTAARVLTPRGLRARLFAAAFLILVSAGVAVVQGTWRELRTATGAEGFRWFGTGLNAMTASRITANAFTSRFFTWLTEGRSVAGLATLEAGSIWHFYSGRPVELLGWTDRRIAEGPRNPAPVLGVLDSRRDLSAWSRESPEIVWLDTQVSDETQFDPAAIARREYPNKAAALLAFTSSSRHWWWTRPYFASEYLLDSYEARLTTVNLRYRILWLVRSDAAAAFDRRLERAGFSVLR
jgi:hypothetical protein